MRRAAKTDLSQGEIVRALRQIGASVAVTSALGKGFPDLVVAFRSKVCMLLEIKTGERPCDRALTADEREFHARWNGPLAVVSTPDEAIEELMRVAKAAGVV